MAISKVILNGVTLMDVTQDTVTAPTLKQGETAHGADGVQVVGTMSGGGGGSSDGDVIFIDYDGTVIDAKTKAEINAMTSDSDLPANPTHTGLTAQGWNWTVTQLKAQLLATPDQKVYVGQMYVTASGATEIDVEMPECRLDPILTISVNGTVSVDWGDGTTPDTVTGTSETTRKEKSHTYASAGNYTISITAVSGTYAFYGSTTYTLLRKNTNSNQNRVYANCVQSIRLGTGAKIGNTAFIYCYSLASVTIPSSVTSIGTSAFGSCYCLQSVTIPSGVTSIGDSAFSGCFSLTSVIIPSGVTSIGSSTFSSCYCLQSVTIPSGVTSIGSTAFGNCYSLTSVIIPSSVTSIGTNAFYNCYSLASIIISNGVTSIGESAFQSCYSLTSVTIPSSVTSIGNTAFSSCYSLKNVTIPSSVTSIGNTAFSTCASLTSITIPSTVTSIGNSVFASCTHLSNITIPSSVTSIGNTAFSGCNSFTSVTIPSSVTSIGNTAFGSCYGVKEYHIEPTTVPTGGTTMFSNIVSDCIIYVPYSADHSILEAYKTATNWSTYASYMQEEPQ